MVYIRTKTPMSRLGTLTLLNHHNHQLTCRNPLSLVHKTFIHMLVRIVNRGAFIFHLEFPRLKYVFRTASYRCEATIDNLQIHYYRTSNYSTVQFRVYDDATNFTCLNLVMYSEQHDYIYRSAIQDSNTLWASFDNDETTPYNELTLQLPEIWHRGDLVHNWLMAHKDVLIIFIESKRKE